MGKEAFSALDTHTAHVLCPKEGNHVSPQEISSFQSSVADENVWAELYGGLSCCRGMHADFLLCEHSGVQ